MPAQGDPESRPEAQGGGSHPHLGLHPPQHSRCAVCAADLPGQLWQPRQCPNDSWLRWGLNPNNNNNNNQKVKRKNMYASQGLTLLSTKECT